MSSATHDEEARRAGRSVRRGMYLVLAVALGLVGFNWFSMATVDESWKRAAIENCILMHPEATVPLNDIATISFRGKPNATAKVGKYIRFATPNGEVDIPARAEHYERVQQAFLACKAAP